MAEWIKVKDDLPKMEGIGLPSKPVLVVAQEFGCEAVIAVARFWKSSIPGQEPVWYLDPDFYGLDTPMRIAQPVYLWMYIPPFPKHLNYGALQGLYTQPHNRKDQENVEVQGD